jgi:hypothetical protein
MPPDVRLFYQNFHDGFMIITDITKKGYLPLIHNTAWQYPTVV